MLYEQKKEFSVKEAMQNIQEVNNSEYKHFKDYALGLPYYCLTHLKGNEQRVWLFEQVKSLESEYRLNHFEFNFDEFCQFVNSRDLDFSPVKEDGTSHFDFSLYYDYRLIAKSHEINWMKRKHLEYLMDIPYAAFGVAQTFLETVVGKKEFPTLRDTVDQDLAKEKKIYTKENYERLMPDIEKMANTKDYRFIHYCHDFIPEEDHEAFKALSDWVDKRDPHYFDKSIHEKGILARSQVRIMETLYPKIHEFSLSDLNNSSKMYEYFNQNGITSTLFQRQLFYYCQDLYWERIEEICTGELEKLMQISNQGINPFFSDLLVYPYDCYLDILEYAKKSMPNGVQAQEIGKIKTWFENCKNGLSRIRYIIETKEDGAVGMIGLRDLDWKNGTASGLGMRVAKKELRTKGIATDAWMTLMRYAFDELRLNRINGSALAYNKVSLHVCQKVGFKIEGTQRQAVYKDGEYHDLVIMGCLKSDYEQLIAENHYWEEDNAK